MPVDIDPITKEDIKLWREERITKKFFEAIDVLKENMVGLLSNEAVLLCDPNGVQKVANTYGVLKAINIITNIDLEDNQKEDEENE